MLKSSVNPYLVIKNLTKSFGKFEAVKNINIDIHEGEFACFLGPSGCGKTTLLRCIAGLEMQTTGSIKQKNKDISVLPPSARDFGIVFQSYALFPNLSVFSNISYGLVNNKWAKSHIKSRVDELLNLVNLVDHADKFPGQLSGGEQQRVALARALATSPGLLLLDEPLSALDAKVRVYLRKQIKDLHRNLGVTTIMVTHDQEEAQSMADRIFVMKDGEIIQSGSPRDIYDRANSPFIADFIGVTNFIGAIVTGENLVRCGKSMIKCDTKTFKIGQAIRIAIRPESIRINNTPSKEDNTIEANIIENEFLGSFERLYLDCPKIEAKHLMVDVSSSKNNFASIKSGTSILITLPADRIRAYSSG